MTNKTQIKVVIKGLVQGVFYRVHTKNTADKLGIKGYVRNLANGSVEAVFEGDQPVVDQMIDWCHKGPEMSRVDHVQTQEIKTLSDFKIFEIRY
jgi:acylphosphatase